MKISDIEKVTGLTAKAIRLYEKKSLISVSRKDNVKNVSDFREEDQSELG